MNAIRNLIAASSLALFCVFLLVGREVNAQSVPESTAAFIRSDALFARATNYAGQLSPNGEFFSYVHYNKDQVPGIELINLKTFEITRVLDVEVGRQIDGYSWLSDDVLFLQVTKRDLQKDFFVNLTKIQTDSGTIIRGKSSKMPYGYIVDVLEDELDKVLFARITSGEGRLTKTLYKLSVGELKAGKFDRQRKIETAPNGLISYAYLAQKKKLVGLFYDEYKHRVEIKIKDSLNSRWKTLITYSDEYLMQPIGFLNDNTYAVLTDRNVDRVGLYAYDLETQELGDLIYEHPDYDLTSAILSKDGELLAVEFIKEGLPQVEWVGSHASEVVARIKASFDNGKARVIAANAEASAVLLLVSGPNNPGDYYFYDAKKDEINALVTIYPDLEDATYPEHKVFRVTSDDGVDMEAFLTLPTIINHNTLLVMPHGGPVGVREYNSFEPELQFLANRGFSILRVNFRGSSGYGKTFRDLGRAQFGQQIEADISLVVDQVMQQHAFENVCAVGASYGAYSSFMLALKHPELYKCIVARYGIYDLPLLFNVSNTRSGKEYERALSYVVGKNTQDKKHLSPLYRATEVNVPVLIVAGENDDIAGFEQSNRMRYVLEKLNKDAEFLFLKRIGHGQTSFYGQQRESAYIVDFLIKKLGLARPKAKELNEQSKSALAYDYSMIGQMFGLSKLVNLKPKTEALKAIEYYKLGSEFGDGNASYNLATYYQTGKYLAKDKAKALALYELAAQQGFVKAHARLGKLYMGLGNEMLNSEKALIHLLKAVELEDSVAAKLELANFYCVAELPQRNIEKCTQMFVDLSAYSASFTPDYYYNGSMSMAIVYGHFNQAQRTAFTKMAVKVLGSRYPNYTLDVKYEGYWRFQEADDFVSSRTGTDIKAEFDSFAAALSSNRGDISIGIEFALDSQPPPSESESDVAITLLEVFSTEGRLVAIDYDFSNTSGGKDLRRRYEVDKSAPGNTYAVSVYDVTGELKYRREYR